MQFEDFCLQSNLTICLDSTIFNLVDKVSQGSMGKNPIGSKWDRVPPETKAICSYSRQCTLVWFLA